MTDSLPTRDLGDLTVSALGFGAMVLSPGMYGEIDDDRAVRALRYALDAGAILIDTSDAYGGSGVLPPERGYRVSINRVLVPERGNAVSLPTVSATTVDAA